MHQLNISYADVETNENIAMDLQNLISCIECHKEEENIEVTFETLKTIVNICAEEEIGKDAFRDVGGLDFLLQFIVDTDQVLILESCLKTLAFVIDKNVHSQMHITQDKVFRILSTIVEKKTYPLGVLKNAIILFSTLLYQNRGAQDMIQENNCLLSLINLYKCFSPISAHHSDLFNDSEHLELWSHINSALCFAVNNPLHEKNQLICSELFPLSTRIVEISSNPTIIKAASSFLSLSIANNEKNQDSFAEADGFFMLKRSLSKNVEEIQLCIRDCNNVIKKDNLDNLNALISIVSAAVSDHENNAMLCGKLGIVSLLTKLLVEVSFDSSSIKKILLVLNNCVDAYSENKLTILQTPKLDVFLKRNLETDDSELYSVAKYLLQICLIDFAEENEETENFCSQNYKSIIGSCHHNCKRNDETGIPEQNTCQQSRNSSDLTKTLDAQYYKSFKEDIPEFSSMDFQTKRNQNTACQSQHSCKHVKHMAFEKDSWRESDSDSLGDTSLHSAHHLFMHSQTKMNKNDQNEYSPKKAKSKNCSTDNELRHMKAESEINNFGLDCLMTKGTASKYTFPNCLCESRKPDNPKQNLTLQRHENKKVEGKKRDNLNSCCSSKMSINSKQGLKTKTKISCDRNKGLTNERAQSLREDIRVDSAQNKFRGSRKKVKNLGIQAIEIDCVMTSKTASENTLQECHCDSRESDNVMQKPSLPRDKNKNHETKKRNKRNSSQSIELPANCKQEVNARMEISCYKNKYSADDERASSLREDMQVYSDLNKLRGRGKIRQPTKPYSFGPHDPSPHHQNNTKVHHPSAGPSRQSHPSNTNGCMEVIVLPDAGCPEHKLTAQFELLRVCPLRTGEKRIS